jgi:type IV secretory pathway TrbD component
MANIQRRSSNRPTRSQRAQRAYQLVMASGVFGLVAVVGLVLAIAGVVGSGLWIVTAIIAVVCFLMFRRTVSGG